MSSQKAIFYLPSLTGGGAERATLDLAGALGGDEYEITVVIDRAVADDYAPPPGVAVVHLRSTSVVQSYFALRRVIRQVAPRILYSALPHLNAVAVLAARSSRTRPKTVLSVHNNLVREFEELSGGRVWRRLTPLAYRLADRIFCVSEGVAEQQILVFGADRRKVRVLPNPIPADEIERRSFEISDQVPPTERPTVVAVGRLVPQKHFELLLRAFASVKAARQDAKMQILGEGPCRGSLTSLAAQLGLADSVEFCGRVQNPFAYMRRAKMLVLSSEYEGFGMVLLEALAVGTPVVSVDCDFGPREIIRDPAFGRLVPQDDIGALGGAIVAELEQTRPEYERETRAAFARTFAPPLIAARAHQLFAELTESADQ